MGRDLGRTALLPSADVLPCQCDIESVDLQNQHVHFGIFQCFSNLQSVLPGRFSSVMADAGASHLSLAFLWFQ